MVHVYGLRCLLLYHESRLNKLFVLTRRFVANATYYGGTLLGTSLFQNDEHCGKQNTFHARSDMFAHLHTKQHSKKQ